MYNINEIKNTVIHGDSEIELLKIPDKSIDCVIIDPPYNLLNHKLDRQFDRELIYKELYRVLKNNSFLVIFGAGLQLCKDIVMLDKIGFEVKEEVIWIKQKASNFLGNLPRRHESFYILSKGEKAINKCYVDFLDKKLEELDLENIKATYDRIKSALKKDCNIELLNKYLNDGVLLYTEKRTIKHKISDATTKRPKSFLSQVKSLKDGTIENTCMFVNTEWYSYKHGTQKPLELMSRIVKLVSNENDIILDCFAGSGSTLLGAIKNDRNYIGIEIDKDYYDICCNRIKEHAGLFA